MRIALLLFVDGMSQAEIAEEIGLSRVTVNKKIQVIHGAGAEAWPWPRPADGAAKMSAERDTSHPPAPELEAVAAGDEPGSIAAHLKTCNACAAYVARPDE